MLQVKAFVSTDVLLADWLHPYVSALEQNISIGVLEELRETYAALLRTNSELGLQPTPAPQQVASLETSAEALTNACILEKYLQGVCWVWTTLQSKSRCYCP